MKILQVSYAPYGFVSEFDLYEEIARAFPPPQHQFTYCTLTGEPDPDIEQRSGCKLIALRLSSKQVRTTRLRTLRTIIRLLRDGQYDLIITHRFKPWLLFSMASCFMPKRPPILAVFHAYHQFRRRRRQWLARILSGRDSVFVAVSSAIREDLVRHGIPAPGIEVIPNAIDIDGIRKRQLSRELARQALGLKNDAIVIGTIGRLRPVKGHTHLLDAFARVAGLSPRFCLAIIGGGELEKDLHLKAEALGLSGRVIISGALPNAYRYLPAFDIFTMTSLSEGLPMAVLEAMATHLPVIGTRVGGIPEALGDTALLVPAADPDALAGALRTALGWDGSQRRDYVSSQSRRLERHFTIDVYRENYLQLAKKIVGKRNAR